MARSIYATFATEGDAERATGALLDHGVKAEEVSFVISESYPQQFVPRSDAPPAPVDVMPPPTRPLPGTYDSGAPVGQMAQSQEVRATPPPLRDRWDVPSGGFTQSAPNSPAAASVAVPVMAATLPPNTPQEIVEHERRPHIIDMETDRPKAADGISTTTAGDAALGAAGGAGIGVGLGILLGIAAALVPGVGWVAGAGGIVASMAAATGVAGGIAGGVFGYLADLGIPTENARLLDNHLKQGGVLLHIEVTGDASEDEIMRILTKYGATSAQGF